MSSNPNATDTADNNNNNNNNTNVNHNATLDDDLAYADDHHNASNSQLNNTTQGTHDEAGDPAFGGDADCKKVEPLDPYLGHRDSSAEPAMEECGNDYAYDGEEASPQSPGLKRMMMEQEKDHHYYSDRDRAGNVIALLLLFFILITAVISIAAGACCLASLSGKTFHHFPMFFAFGVAPVVLGCIGFVLALVFIILIAASSMGFRNYAMCCYRTTSRCVTCGRVCLYGIFPFICWIVLLAMCILGFTFYSLSQQLPPLDKTYTEVDGITGPITIRRDANGLPHIKASSRRDAYLGQGFAVAQDRLFQLEFHRLVAMGKLSEAVGKDGFSTDVGTRTLNIKKAAHSLCNCTSPELLDFLEAFAEGANLYMKRVSKRPVEFFFMGNKPLYFYDPKPFHAIDLCLTARLYQWQMSSNVDAEGARFKVWAGTTRTYAQVEELFQVFTDEKYTIMDLTQMETLMSSQLAAGASVATAIATNTATQAASEQLEGTIYDMLLSAVRTQLMGTSSSSASSSLHDQLQASTDAVLVKTFYQKDKDVLRERAFANKFVDASNAWAARDAAGHACAASDPHLTVNLPSIWYWVHLSYPSATNTQYDTAGVSLMGLPGVHIGRTTYLSWGITMSKTDMEDLFVLPPATFSGLADGTYLYDGELRVMVPRRERIKIKGKKDYVLDVQDTLFGPVVSSMLGFPSALQVALFAVPLRLYDNESFSALLSMSDPEVQTADQLMNSLLNLQAPGFSIPIADTVGNIAYVVTGRHPARALGHTGKYPTVAMDSVTILDQICRLMYYQATGTPLAANVTCSLGALSSGSGSSSLNVTALLPQLQALIQATGTWKTYVSSDPSQPDTYIPHLANPHLFSPANSSTAFAISTANQKIVPDGYSYFLGADYAMSYRGMRLQEMLAASTDLSSLDEHQKIQMDHRSNIWARTLQPVVAAANFTALVANSTTATYWQTKLLAWDMDATLGSVETAFMWRWIRRMATIPADAIAASGSSRWAPGYSYLERMFTMPTTHMLAVCLAALPAATQATTTSTQACLQFAATTFIAQADDKGTGFSERWGIDLSRLLGLHEMLSKKIVHPVFQRTMNKAGDGTSVAVNNGDIDLDSLLSSQASSMRQLYDMWNDTTHVRMMFPGGSSGNPYSKYYQNLWDKFEAEEYYEAAATWTEVEATSASHSQQLSP